MGSNVQNIAQITVYKTHIHLTLIQKREILLNINVIIILNINLCFNTRVLIF